MNSHAGAVLDQLDRLFNRGTVAGLGEGALLERYVAGGDEAAFAALVARHGPMVLGVCRRVLRDERDVEDAFQATFLVLVRRAGAIRDGDLVGRWLHGVAHRVAVRARAHSARRFVHEQSVSEPIEAVAFGRDPDEAERRELAAIVDEEVTRLPSTLRAPVVLCYLEGMSHDEAARRLRWPVGTVRSRMARARDVLRHRLARRGVTADGAALAATLVRPPVPPEWLDATVRGSLHFATYPATAAATMGSARSVALARRMLHTMVIAKLSCIGAAGLGIVLALGGVRTLAFQGPAQVKPFGLASSASRKAGGQDPAPKEAAAAESEAKLRAAALELEILEVEILEGEAQIRSLNEKIIALRERLAKSRKSLDAPGRDKQPAPVQPAASAPIPATPASKVGRAGDPERPQYISLGQTIVIISPDGAKAAVYDPQSGKSRLLKLPMINGVRREFLVNQCNSFETRPDSRPGLQMPTASSPWFTAVELDRDRRVQCILAFNVVDETVAALSPPRPYIERSSVRVLRPDVLCLGHCICAFSHTEKQWGVLGRPDGPITKAIIRQESVWAERDGRLYMFNPATLNWDDIYARAIEGDSPATSFDTRKAPAQ